MNNVIILWGVENSVIIIHLFFYFTILIFLATNTLFIMSLINKVMQYDKTSIRFHKIVFIFWGLKMSHLTKKMDKLDGDNFSKFGLL